jgi:hypothetical protein
MKKMFLIFSLIIISQKGFDQNLFDIKSSSKWKITHIYNGHTDLTHHYNGDEIYNYFIENDTVINSIRYFKIYKSGVFYQPTAVEYSHKYYAAVRETENKVYCILKDKDSEELLYDFNLHVGDTIKGLVGRGRKVLDIDTLNDGRKTFKVSKLGIHLMESYITEGIGSTGGFFEEPTMGHWSFYDYHLICYSENSEVKYDNGSQYVGALCDRAPSRFPINPEATWEIHYASVCNPDGHLNGDDIFKYYIKNDTIIGSSRYYKLYKSGVAYYDVPYYYSEIYVGALRDEDNKFYFIKNKETTEQFLLDFNLKVEDTIKCSTGKGFVVKKVELLSDGRKKIYYGHEICAGCCPVDEMVEGIGHAGGIMEESPCLHPCFRGHFLLCYSENENLIYHENYGIFKDECGTSSIPEILNGKFKVWPSPSKDMVSIEITNSADKVYNIEVYNLSGDKLISDKLYRQTNSTTLDLTFLKDGMYLIRIKGSHSCFTNKLIIRR